MAAVGIIVIMTPLIPQMIPHGITHPPMTLLGVEVLMEVEVQEDGNSKS